jgi:hypothetical protein
MKVPIIFIIDVGKKILRTQTTDYKTGKEAQKLERDVKSTTQCFG